MSGDTAQFLKKEIDVVWWVGWWVSCGTSKIMLLKLAKTEPSVAKTTSNQMYHSLEENIEKSLK